MPTPLESCGPIAPPFDFNHSDVSRHSPEVTGRLLLNCMCMRLGWPSLAGRRLLDFGCGVRFARTIFNLEIALDAYAGIDVNAQAIAWLKANVPDARLRFVHLDMHNGMYNAAGGECAPTALVDLGLGGFDAACMFSVITHQQPADAALIFAMLRPCARQLYFTAFIDDAIADYAEGDPAQPRLRSTYSTAHITALLDAAGWKVESTYAPGFFQMAAFVCR